MESEEVVVQSQLPFVVKEEPIDDGYNVCFEERIKIGPEASTSNDKPIQEATNSDIHEKRICQLEKICRDVFEQFNNLKEKLSHEVPINDQQALIEDLRDQLARKNATCVTHSVESDEKMQLMSSKYETILRKFGQQRESIDQHLKEIEDLKTKSTDKDLLYVTLVANKNSVENELQQRDKQTADVKKELDEMSQKYYGMVTAKGEVESHLKNLTDQHNKNVEDLQIQLKDQEAQHQKLLTEKQNLRDEIESSLMEKHSSEISKVKKEFQETLKQRDEDESLMKVSIDQHLKEIEELKTKLSDKDSLLASLETDIKSVENEVQQDVVRSNLYCSTQQFVKDELKEMSTKHGEIS